jgi:putative amino-acid transport system ATP-binding protein
MIRIRNLSKRFNNTLVLDGIDLDIEDGERIVLIGPSGTGKSTLLRCLNFLETPDEGEVTIGELTVNVRTARKESILALRRKTAFVFQNYALFANKTARENITEGLITVRAGHRKERSLAPMRYWKTSECRRKAMPIRHHYRAASNRESVSVAPWRSMHN